MAIRVALTTVAHCSAVPAAPVGWACFLAATDCRRLRRLRRPTAEPTHPVRHPSRSIRCRPPRRRCRRRRSHRRCPHHFPRPAVRVVVPPRADDRHSPAPRRESSPAHREGGCALPCSPPSAPRTARPCWCLTGPKADAPWRRGLPPPDGPLLVGPPLPERSIPVNRIPPTVSPGRKRSSSATNRGSPGTGGGGTAVPRRLCRRRRRRASRVSQFCVHLSCQRSLRVQIRQSQRHMARVSAGGRLPHARRGDFRCRAGPDGNNPNGQTRPCVDGAGQRSLLSNQPGWLAVKRERIKANRARRSIVAGGNRPSRKKRWSVTIFSIFPTNTKTRLFGTATIT